MLQRVVRAFGLLIAIQTDAPDLFELLDPQLPSFPEEISASRPHLHYRVKVRPRGGLAVLRGRRTIATAPDVPAASALLVTDLQSAMARQAMGYTFVHSGVVAIDGQALLLPARSHAGKSTLVAALLRAGASYGSDELAVVDATGRVHPYSRRLALRTSHAIARVAADELGAQAVTTGLPVAAVVFTEFREGTHFDPARVSVGNVVLGLLQNCLGARGRPKETLAALQRLARDAAGFAGPRGEAEPAAKLLVARASHGWETRLT